MHDRREIMGGAFAVAALAAFPARAQDVAPADLAPGPLSDVFVGSADAKVTIYEYASLTCTHCARFHEEGFPHLKAKWVDTGKARYALREFPLDNLSLAAFMLARARTDADYYPTVGLMFASQDEWAFQKRIPPLEALAAAAAKAGIDRAGFDACLKNEALYRNVVDARAKAADTLKIAATPTFFVNGRRRQGGMTPDDIDALLGPLAG